MKANELFIGAWVLYKGTHHKILGIHKDDSGDYRGQIDDEFKQWYLLSEFKPIPITDEILGKNFEKKDVRVMFGTQPHYVIIDDYYDFSICETNDGLWCAEYDNCEATFPTCRNLICFVHELQMVLTLNGIDKEFML